MRPGPSELLHGGGFVDYVPAFLAPDTADVLFEDLLAREGFWEQIELLICGRRVLEPRRTRWVADFAYRYSGVTRPAFPWDPALSALRDAVERRVFGAPCGRYRGVLLNHYRTGADALGWHGDREGEISQETPIATISLGVSRRFRMRDRRGRRPVLDGELAHGSLFLMGPGVQLGYDHCVPRQALVAGSRISLTFRGHRS